MKYVFLLFRIFAIVAGSVMLMTHAVWALLVVSEPASEPAWGHFVGDVMMLSILAVNSIAIFALMLKTWRAKKWVPAVLLTGLMFLITDFYMAAAFNHAFDGRFWGFMALNIGLSLWVIWGSALDIRIFQKLRS